MAKTVMSFNQALQRFRTIITNRVRQNGTVSALDITDNIPSVSGPRRGAVVRRAFESLVADGVIRKTTQTVYNAATHHSVTVYRAR